MNKKDISIIDFVTDPQLLGLSISQAQETLLRASDGLPPKSRSQREIYRSCTGRETWPRHGFDELTIIAGARSGKDSRIATPTAAHKACFGGYEKHLARGERAVIPLVASSREGTRIAFEYLKSYFTESALLKSMLDTEPYANEIRLKNRVSIQCFPSTLASLRGWSIPVAIMDEVGFFRLEGSADSDVEIQSSIRRGMIAFENTKLIKISTPYMKSGVLYDDFKQHYGKDSPDMLVWRASTTLMNPAIKESRLDAERRKDPSRFAREYEAEFAEDLESFLPAAWIEQAIIPGRYELPCVRGKHYAAGVDTSGLGSGKGADSFTLAVCHYEKDVLVQDVCKGWKKSRSGNVDLEGIVNEIASLLKRYNLRTVHGDKYGANWVIERFKNAGVTYQQTDHDKSFYYLEAEPLFAQGKIEILDHPELARELRMLERRPRPGGKTIIDHPANQHDDHANSLVISAVKAKKAIVHPGFPLGVGSGFFAGELTTMSQRNPFTSFGSGSGGRLSVGLPVSTGSEWEDD